MYFIKVVLISLALLINRNSFAQPEDHTTDQDEVEKCSSDKKVCGTDGKTYNNICLLQKETGVTLAHEGDCKRKKKKKTAYRPDLILKSKIVNATEESLQKKLVKHFNPTTGKWEYVIEILPTIVITPTFHHLQMADDNQPRSYNITNLKTNADLKTVAPSKFAPSKFGLNNLPFLGKTSGGMYSKRKLIIDNLKGPFNRNNSIIKEIVNNVTNNFPRTQVENTDFGPMENETISSLTSESHPSAFPSQQISGKKSPVPRLQTVLNIPEPLNSVEPTEFPYQQRFRSSETPPSFNESEIHPNQSHPSTFSSKQITEKKSPVPQLQKVLNEQEPLISVEPTEFPYQQSFRSSETPPSFNETEIHPNQSHPSAFPSQQITEKISPVPQLQTVLNIPRPLNSVEPTEFPYQHSFRSSETPPSFNETEIYPNQSHPSAFPSQQITDKKSPVPQLQKVLNEQEPLNSVEPTEFPYQHSFRGSETPPSFNETEIHPNQSHPSAFPSQQITEKKSPVPQLQTVLNIPRPLNSVEPTEFPYQHSFRSSETPPSFNVSEIHPNQSHPSVFPSQQITDKKSPVPQLQTVLNKPKPLNTVVVPTEFPYQQSFRSSERPPSFNASESHPNQSHPSVFPSQQITEKKSPVPQLQTVLNEQEPLNSVDPTEFPYQQGFRSSETPPSFNETEIHPNQSHPSVFPSQQITEKKSPVPQLQTVLNKPKPLYNVVVPTEFSYQQNFRSSETPPSFNASESHPNQSHPSVFPSQQITVKKSPVPQFQTVLNEQEPLNSVDPTEFPYQQSFRSSERPPSFNASESHPNQSHPSVFPLQQITEKKSPVPQLQTVLNKPKPLNSVVVPTEFPYQQNFRSSETPPSFNASESRSNQSHPSVFPSQQITEKKSPVPRLQTVLNIPVPLNSVEPTEFPYQQSFGSSETIASFNASESHSNQSPTLFASRQITGKKSPFHQFQTVINKPKSFDMGFNPGNILARGNHLPFHRKNQANLQKPLPENRRIRPKIVDTLIPLVSPVTPLDVTELLKSPFQDALLKNNSIGNHNNEVQLRKNQTLPDKFDSITDLGINGSLNTKADDMARMLVVNATKTPKINSGNVPSQLLAYNSQNYQIPKRTYVKHRPSYKPKSQDHHPSYPNKNYYHHDWNVSHSTGERSDIATPPRKDTHGPVVNTLPPITTIKRLVDLSMEDKYNPMRYTSQLSKEEPESGDHPTAELNIIRSPKNPKETKNLLQTNEPYIHRIQPTFDTGHSKPLHSTVSVPKTHGWIPPKNIPSIIENKEEITDQTKPNTDARGLSPNWRERKVSAYRYVKPALPSNLAGNFNLKSSWVYYYVKKKKTPKPIRTPIDVREKQVKYDYKWKIGGNNKGGQPIGNEEIQPIKSVNVTADKTVTPMKHSFGERGLTGRKIPTRRLHNLVERLGNVHLDIPKITTKPQLNTTSPSVKTEKTRPATNLYPGWYYMEMLFNVPGGGSSANSNNYINQNNYSGDPRKSQKDPTELLTFDKSISSLLPIDHPSFLNKYAIVHAKAHQDKYNKVKTKQKSIQ